MPTFISGYVKLTNPNNMWFEVHYHVQTFTSEDDFAQLIVWKPDCKVLVFHKAYFIPKEWNCHWILFAYTVYERHWIIMLISLFIAPGIHDKIIIGWRSVCVHGYISISIYISKGGGERGHLVCAGPVTHLDQDAWRRLSNWTDTISATKRAKWWQQQKPVKQ